MPRRALRCVVDLNIEKLSAPGVWLPSKEDLYISVSIFGQYRNTRNVTSVFPMILLEPFRFEKTYYTAVDPGDVAEFLEDELVVVELLQYSDYSDGAVRLASFSTSAREFLFPYPSLCPSYTSASREILLSRTIAWPGISPKLEFSTKTIIKDSRSPELDALEDALEEEKLARRSRSRSRSRTRGRSISRQRGRSVSRSRSRTRTCRSKSAVCKSYDAESLSDTDAANKAPFVVRHLESSLIGRTPGAAAKKGSKTGKKKSRGRSSSRPSSALSGYDSWDDDYDSIIRDGEDALPVYTTKYLSDDEDYEVAELTSRPIMSRGPRSVSPYLYKPSYSCRFGPSSISYADKLEVDLAVERARARAHARALAVVRSRSPSPVRARARAVVRSRSPSPVRSYTPNITLTHSLSNSLDNLEIDTALARRRRFYPDYLA